MIDGLCDGFASYVRRGVMTAMAVHPVTNREYALFLDETANPPPLGWQAAGFNDVAYRSAPMPT